LVVAARSISPTDDEELRIDCHRQTGDADPERAGRKMEKLDRQRITVLREAV
jgi:hypothetical protein